MIDINHQAEEYAKLAREIYRYKHLSHPNIIPIYKTMIIQRQLFYAEIPCMISSLESIMTYRPLNNPAGTQLIMSNRHRYGITVDCLAIRTQRNTQGSFLVKHSHPQILLAFAGTMHEHNIFNDDTRNWISSSSSITTTGLLLQKW